MTLYARQQKRHRYAEWTFGLNLYFWKITPVWETIKRGSRGKAERLLSERTAAAVVRDGNMFHGAEFEVKGKGRILEVDFSQTRW